MEQRYTGFNELEEFVRLPPHEVAEAHGKRLTAGGRGELYGESCVIDDVAKPGEGAGVGQLLHPGFDFGLGDRHALMPAGLLQQFGGVETRRALKVDGLWDVGLGYSGCSAKACRGENEENTRNSAHDGCSEPTMTRCVRK